MRYYFFFTCIIFFINCRAQEFCIPGTLTEPAKKEYLNQKGNLAFLNRTQIFAEPGWVTPPYFDRGSDKGGYRFSGDVQYVFAIGSSKLRPVVHLNPRVKLRVFLNNEKFNDRSYPVRTPSYLPGGTLFYPIKRIKGPYDNVQYLSFRYCHHSNGQDGEPFLSTGEYNTYNADFSTELVEIGYNLNIRKKRKPGSQESCDSVISCQVEMNQPFDDLYGRIAIEQHAFSKYPLPGLYGRTRINLHAGFIRVNNFKEKIRAVKSTTWENTGTCYQRERFRTLISTSINVDQLQIPYNSISKRVNVELSGFLRFLSGNTAAYLSMGYYGNDPYNVYFQHSYAYIRAGVAVGNFVNTNKSR